uniref:Uncharacterized protein n=1 Tax=Anguilla anguilla TaxID=7936 RepID=A0A0E9PGM6_ANGAN
MLCMAEDRVLSLTGHDCESWTRSLLGLLTSVSPMAI